LSCNGSENGELIIAFYHPHCAAGGGGERVLWKAIQALGELRDSGMKIKVVIYTIDPPRKNYHQDVLDNARDRFSVLFAPSLQINFVHVGQRQTMRRTKRSLIAQSFDTMKLAFNALQLCTPHVFFDTTGAAFTFIIAKLLAGCKVCAYVHYPSISTDMLSLVWERRPSYNNAAAIVNNPVSTYLKLIYYTLFAIVYGAVGSLSDVVMVNSTWTFDHIHYLWRLARSRIHIVYPPCDTASLELFTMDNRKNVILSIGQFRPEKDHILQVKSFARMLSDHPEVQTRDSVKLVLIGSCRDKTDEGRVLELRNLISSFGITDHVEFVLNQPFSVLKQWLGRASIGLHTMWNEHFGIGVVEMMAAGIITIAHNSGGPKSDIIVPLIRENEPSSSRQRTGFLASTEEQYAHIMFQLISSGTNSKTNLKIREAGRESSKRFSDEIFSKTFKEVIVSSSIF